MSRSSPVADTPGSTLVDVDTPVDGTPEPASSANGASTLNGATTPLPSGDNAPTGDEEVRRPMIADKDEL